MSSSTAAPTLHDIPSNLLALCGVARRDITPPVGIYSRMWGAALHDQSEGTHRPLTVTVLALRTETQSPPLLLAVLDACIIPDRAQELALRQPLLDRTAGDPARALLHCTHSHGVGMWALNRADQPGGHLIAPFVEQVKNALAAAADEALATMSTALLTWATGRCTLASNRDLPDPDPARQRWLTGYNPQQPADDTLLIGRITRERDATVLATLVNYACHPTTLAWENRLISPDYVGALRQIVEQATDHAPCLFLQGASGELAPRWQYVGDVAVADQHGRQLAYAALSTLTGMLPHRQALRYVRCQESGAPLAVWRPAPFTPSRALKALRLELALPMKPLPSPQELEAQLAAAADRVLHERLKRKLQLVQTLGQGPTSQQHAWVWRLGSTCLVAHPNEAYSQLQLDLRQALAPASVVVLNVTNGWGGYLYPPAVEGRDLYPVWQSPFTGQALGTLTTAATAAARQLLTQD